MKSFTTKASVIQAMRDGASVDVNYRTKTRYVVKNETRVGMISDAAYLELMEAGVMVLVHVTAGSAWWRYALERKEVGV